MAQKAKEEGYEGVNFDKITSYNQKKQQLELLQTEVDKLHTEIIQDEKKRAEKKDQKSTELMQGIDSDQLDMFAKHLAI